MSEFVDAELHDEIDRFLDTYYREDIGELAQHYPREQTSLSVSYRDLSRGLPDLADRVFDEADEVKSLLKDALLRYDLPIDIDLSNAEIRLTDFPDSAIWDVGSWPPNEIDGRLQGVHGQVSKVSSRQQLLTSAVFDCQRCGTPNEIPQTNTDTLQEPAECHGCERQGPFVINTAQSTRVDYQRVRLQTLPENAHGMTSDDLDVALTGDLVGDVMAGERIISNTHIKSKLKSEGQSKKPILELYGDVESVEKTGDSLDDVEVDEYLDDIREVANSDDPVQQIIDSINPRHMGDEDIKEAIAYQLFGGVKKELADGSTVRGNSHMLLIGDPGTGKSTHLLYANELMPRSVFTTGQGSTAAGLTASAVNDDFTDGWSLKAGALVEATGGLCAIDELDDMREEDRAGMLQAMSQQAISISKAGINQTLPAETTILAAANPRHGRFDPHSKIDEQLDLDPALISRFDLIFTLQDEPEEEHDMDVARHMAKTAQAGERRTRAGSDSVTVEGEIEPPISKEMMRAYIAHARSITPVLTDGAIDLLTDSYVDIRTGNEESNAVPVTARMNEAVIRLSEASARIHLREDVTRDDVAAALSIHKAFLEDVGLDPESGEFDADIVESGTTTTQRNRIRKIKSFIDDLARDSDKGAPIEDLHELLEEYDEDTINHEIQKLKNKGEVYEPSTGHLRSA